MGGIFTVLALGSFTSISTNSWFHSTAKIKNPVEVFNEVHNPGGICAVNDTMGVVLDHLTSIYVLLNDTDDSGQMDSTSIDTSGLVGPSHGTITGLDTLNAFFTYLPDHGFIGQDSFQYFLCDTLGICDTAWVFLDVDCYTDPGSITITGSVFEDANLNRLLDPSEVVFDSIRIRLYEDTNNNGIIDSGEPLIAIDITDQLGNYFFQVVPDFNGLPDTTISSIEFSSDDVTEYGSFCFVCQSPDWNPGCLNLTSRNIDFGSFGLFGICGNRTNGLRFSDHGIPKGATIIDASIEFESSASSSFGTHLTFHGITSDFSTFDGSQNSITSRSATGNTVTWNSVPSWIANTAYTSPDLSSIIQEIVDLVNWDADSSILFKIDGTGFRQSYSYDFSPDRAAQLEVIYTEITHQNYIVEIDTSSFPSSSYCLGSPQRQLVTFDSLGQANCSTSNSLVFSLNNVTVSYTQSDVTCYDGMDGSIDLTVMTGTGPFMFDWDNDGTGDYDDSEDLSGLAAGVYKVNVLAPDGCVVSEEIVLYEPVSAELSFSVINNFTCSSDSMGIANVNVSGGVAPYTFLWNTGSTNDTIFDLTPGRYIVTVTDSDLCEVIDSFELSEPFPLEIDARMLEPITCENSLGSVYVEVTVGDEPFTYSWSTGASTDTIFNLPAGTYYVTVTDDQGCSKMDSVELLGAPPAANTYIGPGYGFEYAHSTSGTRNEVFIVGVPDGGLASINSGGTSWISIKLSETLNTNDTIWINAKSASFKASTFEVSANSDGGPLWADTTALTATALLSSLGYIVGSDNIQYIRIEKNGNTNAEGLEVDGITYHRYSCVPLDCRIPEILVSDEGFATTYVSGGMNGTNAIGAPDNSYASLKTGELVMDLDTILPQGSYVYAYLASNEINNTFNYADDFSGDVFSETDNNSGTHHWASDSWTKDTYGGSNGGDVSAGTFEDRDNNFGDSERVLRLKDDSAGVYRLVDLSVADSMVVKFDLDIDDSSMEGGEELHVQVSNDNGASYFTLLTYITPGGAVNLPENIEINVGSPSILPGSSTARFRMITGSTTAGNEDFWIDNVNVDVIQADTVPSAVFISGSDDNTTYVNPQNVTTITPVPHFQQFKYEITQSAGARYIKLSGATAPIALDAIEFYFAFCEIPPLSLSETHVDVNCYGESTGSIDLTVQAGALSYSYDWDNDGIGDFDDAQDLANIQGGVYKVVVTDTVGQKDSLVITITEPAELMLTEFHSDVSCYGAGDGSADLTISGGIGPFQIDWDNNGLGDTDDPEDLTNLPGGTYKVVVTDSNGCIDSLSVEIAEPGNLDLSDMVGHISCAMQMDGSVDLMVSGGSAPYIYNWSNSETTQDIFNLGTGTYSVTVTDNNGCVDSLEVMLIIESDSMAITGTVFNDGNANGVKEVGESGIGNIIAHAYDDLNVPVSVDTSDSFGKYSLPGLVPGMEYRLEFIDIPTGYNVSVGPDSESEVQFAFPGDCQQHLGLYTLADYCESDPFIITPCYVDGEYNGTYASEPVLVRFPLSADGHDFTGTTPDPSYQVEKLVRHDEVGTVYGITWQAKSGTIFTSAFHKRYSGFGPNGPDAIYQLDLDGNILGVIQLDALLGTTNSTGGDVHDWSVGPNSHVYDIGRGAVSYDAVGKRGFGDIELSSDQNALFVVNLFDRKIYALDVSDGLAGSVSIINSWSTPDQLGNGDHRPFGLAWHDEKLWVGSVDENSLFAYVHTLDVTSGLFSLQLTVPLNYPRQAFYGNAGNWSSYPSAWNTWESSPYGFSPYDAGREIGFPQAMLTDMEFADNGDMILGFRDRFGDQSGAHRYFDTTQVAFTSAIASGDILKACLISGSYVLETGLTGQCPGTGGLPNSGPGGQEFYYWDVFEEEGFLWNPNTNNGSFHWETTQGGLLQIPGNTYVMTTAMDPYDDFSGGVLKLDNSTGRRVGVGTSAISRDTMTGGYTIFDLHDWDGAPPSSSVYAGKANGLGDLEAACMLPISIGNYVWFDENQNGIQDPGEPPLVNVALELYQDSILIGRDTTDANGKYHFGGVNNENVFDGVSIRPLTYTEIKIPFTSVRSNDGSVTGITSVTEEKVQLDTNDFIDSDGTQEMLNDTVVAQFFTGFLGTTSLFYDFGFIVCQEDHDTIRYSGCEGDGYFVNVGSSTYDETNPMGEDTLTNIQGCDSIITTILTFYTVYRDTIEYTGCEDDGYAIMVGTTTYNENNPTGIDTFTSIDGCDSIIVVDLQYNPKVVVDAGMLPGPVCPNVPITLAELSASITGGINTGKWTTSGTGAFDNNGDFGGVTPSMQYVLSNEDIDNKIVILTLTSNDPPGLCEPEADAVLIIINDNRCSQFPFTGGQ